VLGFVFLRRDWRARRAKIGGIGLLAQMALTGGLSAFSAYAPASSFKLAIADMTFPQDQHETDIVSGSPSESRFR
jgi:hypothetical protein